MNLTFISLRAQLIVFVLSILPPAQTEKHREDRLKAAAGAFQTAALSIVGIGVFTPLFTALGSISGYRIAIACGAAAVAQTVSLTLLLYIRYPDSTEDNSHG